MAVLSLALMLGPQSQAQMAREPTQSVRESKVQPSRTLPAPLTAWSSQAPSGLSGGHRPAVPTQAGHPQQKHRRTDPLTPAGIEQQKARIRTAQIPGPMRFLRNRPERLQDREAAQTSMAAQGVGVPRNFD